MVTTSLEGTVYSRTYNKVVDSYKRSWIRWFLSPNWRALAAIDAHYQALDAHEGHLLMDRRARRNNAQS